MFCSHCSIRFIYSHGNQHMSHELTNRFHLKGHGCIRIFREIIFYIISACNFRCPFFQPCSYLPGLFLIPAILYNTKPSLLNNHTVLCLIKVNINTIELTVHTFCNYILDLLCAILYLSAICTVQKTVSKFRRCLLTSHLMRHLK